MRFRDIQTHKRLERKTEEWKDDNCASQYGYCNMMKMFFGAYKQNYLKHRRVRWCEETFMRATRRWWRRREEEEADEKLVKVKWCVDGEK